MGLTPDLMNESFDDITSWTDNDTGDSVSQINPAGQLELDTNNSAAGNTLAVITKIITLPNQFTADIKIYLDNIGAVGNGDGMSFGFWGTTWAFVVVFSTDGLWVYKAGGARDEVGADIVKCNATAAWQIFRFQIDKTVESAATVEVFSDNVSQGTFDCDYEVAVTPMVRIYQNGNTTDNMVSHIDYIRIATGLGEINDTDQIQAGII